MLAPVCGEAPENNIVHAVLLGDSSEVESPCNLASGFNGAVSRASAPLPAKESSSSSSLEELPVIAAAAGNGAGNGGLNGGGGNAAS